ncbi:MAG TPA: ATP-binding protein [Ideonella sp.]|uniref:ATP-binding protein n=1 Tax=Ideonella sp. TaxID=1929293 RepID=UPI002BC3BC63|nr:ATP-binding protein [Ideonella sp.]HSI51440.1 ATP-binding protein [Ideonella sp.]
MNAPRLDPPLLALLDAEWQRLDHLVGCLSHQRAGQALGEAELARLRELQGQVELLRGPQGAWHAALGEQLSPIEIDVLVCALAPELEPRLGWAFQALQANAAQPWATRALIQELLALDATQAEWLRRALAPDGLLRRRRWIVLDQEDAYRPLQPDPSLVARLCGMPVEPAAPPGATEVKLVAGWHDLVLPPSRIAMLREYLMWIAHRDTVVGQWGGRAVGGPVGLFAGPSGTGKTFAASVIAQSLGWRLYRVDLGRLVSKYVGETEQNLNRLFDAAHGLPMVLQFDEADALFAKRGEVKEARDRYANMEVSHLLTRIEAHDGPCILTTNLRKQLDSAFTRRFQMVVEFPRPDAPARAELWRRLLPPQAPLAPEVTPEVLGDAVALSGGSIRNAALHAAYLAASQGASIGLPQLAHAIWRELAKEGRELALQDLGPLAAHLPEGLRDEH